MAKEERFSMGFIVYSKAKKPLRKREDFILLLLYTIREISVNKYVRDVRGEIYLYVDKMSRLFYVMDNKIFTVHFPFSVEYGSENNLIIYDRKNGMEIDARVNSILISLFEEKALEEASFEGFIKGLN